MSPRKSEVDIALEEWADSAGVERRVEIAQGRFGRGLFATQALSAGELALRVPLSATLSDDHRSRHGAGSAEVLRYPPKAPLAPQHSIKIKAV